MKRRNAGAAPPPSKRGQRRRYEQEFDQETGEMLSMETRARRARELVKLKNENESLKKERQEFLAKIESLSSQLESFTREEAPETIEEHQFLQREMALHSDFIASFQTILREEESAEARSKQALYAQGAEAANSFLLGLLSESVTWARAAPPPGINIPLLELGFRYAFRKEMFGKADAYNRLDLRLDAFVPAPATAESVQSLFFRALCTASDMQRLYGASESVNMFPLDSPSDNTQLLYFRRSALESEEKDQFTIFICNRSTQTMTKSSITPPADPRHGTEPVFGTAKAHIVAMTTSTLFPKDPTMPIDSAAAVPVSGMIVKGVIAWDDHDSTGVRLTVIYSVPEDYKIINTLCFQDLVSKDSDSTKARKKARKHDLDEEHNEHCMTEKFAHVLVSVANEFKAMMAERPNSSAQAYPSV